MATVIYALIVILALATPAAAQTTRVETIAVEQSEKAKALQPEGPSDAERIIRRILLSPLLSGGEGLYPWFGSVYSGTGMAAGAGFIKHLARHAWFNAQAGISINNSKVLRAEFAAPELKRGLLQFDASGQWLDARSLSFYGFGQDSDPNTREFLDFAPKEIRTNLRITPRRLVSLAGGYAFMNFDTQRETPIFSASAAPGLDEELNYHVTGATLALDSRPAPAYSTRGSYLRASIERYEEAQGRPFSFVAQEYEVTQLVPLVREQFVLAAHALVTMTKADEGEEVPVMLAPYLGSGSTLRGYPTRRFTDRNRVLATAEYRWRPSRYMDMALFVDAGQVAPDRRDFRTADFDVDWGIGARFHGPTTNALRIDIARGREGVRLIFAGSQPF
jgi:hypothetical protein